MTETGAARGRLGSGLALFSAALTGVAVGAAAVWLLVSGEPAGRTQTEAVVRDYILAHPEIIPEAIDRLRERETAAAVAQHREELQTPFAGAWAGAEQGDVVLVEFFDYACSYCRAANPDVERLLEEDPRLKVVWRELPVLGPPSEQAAIASLAAARQGREAFQAFHETLFEAGRPTPASIEAAARRAGVGADAIRAAAASPEVAQEIGRNLALARAIGATGTPTFIVGEKVLEGAVGYEVLKAAVEAARAG